MGAPGVSWCAVGMVDLGYPAGLANGRILRVGGAMRKTIAMIGMSLATRGVSAGAIRSDGLSRGLGIAILARIPVPFRVVLAGLSEAPVEAPAPDPEPDPEPAREPETDPVAEPAPSRAPEPPLPDPATLLRSPDRLAFPDGFTAIRNCE